MGDLQVWPLQPNGVLLSEENPDPCAIGDDRWATAEKRTSEIICKIRPTLVSEQRRKAVFHYVQSLIRFYLGSEVFPFGSVPLKTYLPDGDIDLTALSPIPNIEDALANDVRSVLEGEGQNKASEFEVKDVQYIHAEVKLVKCLVQNIVVDISFNQFGGLGTLCFLEQVDRLIGKDHLFKHSIILIKAWCYYESRILGAYHGLISTYALETLVLYIFHLFHSSLRGPLEVLYRFLDHFSKFDWDNYCVSLNGPVCVSSLPDIAAETPENDGGDLLLSKEFLQSCVDMFSVPSKGSESNSRSFPLKHLNIVDPLKDNNNLGRSVSKGNFYRIRSAFTYGARKLGRILLLSEESSAEELNKFFMNTLDRHGSGQRPDVQDPIPVPLGLNEPGLMSSKSDIKESTEDQTVAESPSVDYKGTLCKEINKIEDSELEKNSGNEIKSKEQIFNPQPAGNEKQRSIEINFSSTILESNGLADGNIVSGSRLAGDATDLASSRISLKLSPPIGVQDRAYHAPHLYFKENGNIYFKENGNIGNGNMDQPNLTNSIIHENKASNDEIAGLVLQPDSNGRGFLSDSSPRSSSNTESPSHFSLTSNNGFQVSSSSLYASEDLYTSNQSFVTNDSWNFCQSSGRRGNTGFRELDLVSDPGSDEAFNSLAELSGDQESHQRSLLYGQWCNDLILYGPVLPYPPSSRSYLHNKNSWDLLHSPSQLKQNVFPHMGPNGVVPASPFPPLGYYHVNPPLLSGVFGVEEVPKPRGTGTYFPNLNHRSYKERHSPGRGRNVATATHTQLQRPRNNGRVMMAPDDFPETANHEPSRPQFPVFNGNGHGKPGHMEFVPAVRPVMNTYPNPNGVPSERAEFSSPLGSLSPEKAKYTDSSTLYTPPSVTNPPMPAIQEPGLGLYQERAAQSYYLKDEDFPPLSI